MLLVPKTRTRRVIRRIARRLCRPARVARPATLKQYESEYIGTLLTTLDIIDGTAATEAAAGLTPICLDPPVSDKEDFLLRRGGRVFRNDMAPLVGAQRMFARKGVWSSFNAFMTIQPRLCFRMSSRAHRYAVRIATLAPSGAASSLSVGTWSVLALITVNNILCLYRLIHYRISSSNGLERCFYFRFDAELSYVKHALHTGLQALKEECRSRQLGDILFIQSIIEPLERIRAQSPPLPYLNGIRRMSPLALMQRLEDDHLWSEVSRIHLQGLEKILDPAAPFQTGSLAVRLWVDALFQLSEHKTRRVFRRIGTMLDDLNAGERATDKSSDAANGYRICLICFIRMVNRAWSDFEASLEAVTKTPEQSQAQAFTWNSILTNVLERLNTIDRQLPAEPGIMNEIVSLSALEYHTFRRILARVKSVSVMVTPEKESMVGHR